MELIELLDEVLDDLLMRLLPERVLLRWEPIRDEVFVNLPHGVIL